MSTELVFEKKFANAVFLLSGIVSLVFGVLLLTRTEGTIEVIMLLLGLWWLIEGLFRLLSIFIDKSQWVWKLVGGILGVLAGLLVLNFPLVGGAIYFSVMVIVLGVFGLLIGAASIVAAFMGGGWKAGLFGVVGVIIGLLLIFNSLLSAKILIWLFAILLIVQGAIALVAAVVYKD